MGLFSLTEQRSSHPSNPDRWFIRAFGGNETTTGLIVDEDEAITLDTVFAALRIISETLASVPVKLYERLDRGKQEKRDNVIWTTIHDEPNEEQTPLEFYEMVNGFVELSGTGYAEIVRDGTGRGREMWPIPSHRVKPKRMPSGALIYEVDLPDGGQTIIPFEDMLTVRGFSRDGVSGVNVVDTVRESLGLAMALERFAGTFFGNGAQPVGVLGSPGRVSPEARTNMRKSWEEAHKGVSRSNRVALLEEGVTYTPTTVDPKNSQAIESRKFSVAMVARMFNIPPHLLKDLERATFSNIEHQSIEFVTYCMRPRFRRWAQAMEKKLILPSQRSRLYIEHVVEELLVGDIKTRFEAYAIARQNGWMNANEIRAKENTNSYDGGDEYVVQSNMIPVRLLEEFHKKEEKAPQPSNDEDEGEDSARFIRPMERMLAACFETVARKWANAARKAMKKDVQAFRVWIDEFFDEEMDFAHRAISAHLSACAEASGSTLDDAGVRSRAEEMARNVADALRSYLKEPETANEGIERFLETLTSTQPAQWAAVEMRNFKKAA